MKALASIILAVVLTMFAVPAQAASHGPVKHTSHAVKHTVHKAPHKAHKAHKAPAKVKAPAKAKAKAPVRCEEDQPCWSCKTMGNRVCGPVKGLTASQIRFCLKPYIGGAWAGSSLACAPYRQINHWVDTFEPRIIQPPYRKGL